MTVTPTRATFLTVPFEIRLRIYHLVFDSSTFTVCGNKFLRGHHNNDRRNRGKHISTGKTYYGPAHVCSQLRYESLPVILNNTTLCCCHMGLRLVETHCLSLYREHIRRVSIDTHSFDTQYIHSLRPDVLHKLCKDLPVFPQLQTLIVRTGPSHKLPKGFKRDTLHSTQQITNGKTMFEEARDHTRQRLLTRGNGTLARILESEDRTYQVQIHTYLGDFHPQDEEGRRGVAAYFGYDWDSRELLFWTLGETPHAEDYYKFTYSKSWYRDRNVWQGFRQGCKVLTYKLLDAFVE